MLARVPVWAKREGFSANAEAIRGAKLFTVAGCLNCHVYLGSGGTNLGAPNLSAEGAKKRGVAFQIAHLKCPECVVKQSPMPSFEGLGTRRLADVAAFLEASEGPKK